jgi:hypothetical protein
MNPEFQRSLWVELTTRRMTLMVVLLALAFFAAAISGGTEYSLAGTAQWLYYAIVVVWGTRNAAMAVVGEIRDRTWDMQLLSSIAAGEMTWGKLFGSTIYNWFGGAICLAVLLSDTVAHQGLPAAFFDLVYYVAVGAISQAAAFLASLIAVRRRQAHSRLDIFIYQVVGLAAGIAVYSIWSIADPAGSVLTHKKASDFVLWWGQSFDTRGFLLASLAAFTAWTLVGCYREMRLELKMRNGIWVWLSFLAFMGLYVAGLDAWLHNDKVLAQWDALSLRLALAGSTFGTLTYLMVVLEPKDRVHYRWLIGQIASGRLAAFLGGLQAWMMSYAAAIFCAAALIASLHQARPGLCEPLALIAAGMGFLTRDVAIFVFMRTRRRGDWAALGILFALYVLAPAIVRGLGMESALMAFYPQAASPLWLGPVIAWAEGIAMVVLAVGRIALAKTDR